MAISKVALVPRAQLGHLQVIIMFPRNTDNWFILDPRLLHVLRLLLMMESTKFGGRLTGSAQSSRMQTMHHENYAREYYLEKQEQSENCGVRHFSTKQLSI